MKFFGSKTGVARFVNVLLNSSNLDLQSIMITKVDTSEVWCVRTVTDGSLDDTVKTMARAFFLQPTST